MNPGDEITIKAVVLRVDGERVDAQTLSGQLIQTHISNVSEKSIDLSEHKAVLSAPETKSVGVAPTRPSHVHRKKNRS